MKITNDNRDSFFIFLLKFPWLIVKTWFKEVHDIPSTPLMWDKYKIGGVKIGRGFGLAVSYIIVAFQIFLAFIALIFIFGFIFKLTGYGGSS